MIDDPAHPDHPKARSAGTGNPSFEPAPPRRAPRRQAARRAAVSSGSQSLKLLGGARGDESEPRRRFRRLVDKVERLRQAVRGWREGRAAIDREIAVYRSEHEEVLRVGRQMVAALDRAHGDSMFSKADRKKLSAMICTIARDLLEDGGHDDLKPLYNRHSRGDFDAEVAAESAVDAQALRSMMEEIGIDFGEADVGSLEKLEEFAAGQIEAEMHAAEAEEATRKDRRGRGRKRHAREERREEETRNAGKALQEVYRKLAMALHPDLERDAAERARKTELMQEVNVAYEARDLLALLELQLRVERVDASRAEAIAEERLAHYSRILDEQAARLAEELDEVELPWRLELDLGPRAKLSPDRVVQWIRADTEDLGRWREELRDDLAIFQERSRLKAWLRSQSAPRKRPGDVANIFG